MQPISAAPLASPKDGLAGVAGVQGPGVFLPDPGTDALDPGNRWGTGFHVEGVACSPGWVGDMGCGNPGAAYNAFRGRFTIGPDARPFLIGEGIECSTMGTGTDLATWNDEAKAALDRVKWVRIAHELWSGTISADHQRLASPAATELSSSPVDPEEAIGALEDAMAQAQAGVPDLIHVPRKAVAYLNKRGLLAQPTATSGRLYTWNTSLLIADRGYPGSGPNGEAATADVVWFYATGPIAARLGDVQVRAQQINEAVRAETNDMHVLAERSVAVGWLCDHFAIPVKLS